MLFVVLCILVKLSKSIFYGSSSVMFLLIAIDSFIVCFRPSLATVGYNNNALAHIINISPLSNWTRGTSQLFFMGLLSSVLAIAAFTKALGYW